MSLFKIDSKIYGAWSVDREEDLLQNDDAPQIPESDCDENSKGNGGISNSPITKHYIKKFFTHKF